MTFNILLSSQLGALPQERRGVPPASVDCMGRARVAVLHGTAPSAPRAVPSHAPAPLFQLSNAPVRLFVTAREADGLNTECLS